MGANLASCSGVASPTLRLDKAPSEVHVLGVRWWLADHVGARRRIDAGGVLLGRSPRCDVVLQDPKASRSQALVVLAGETPQVMRLGRGFTRVNGDPVERERELRPEDWVEVPGARMQVLAEDAPGAAATTDGGWVLQNPAGVFFGVSASPFSIGGASTDALCIADWPPQALVLHLTAGRIHLEAAVPVEVDGEAHGAGATVPLQRGSSMAFAGQTLRLVAGGMLGGGSTELSESSSSDDTTPRAVLHFLPRGARFGLDVDGEVRSVYLPGQRSELMALLLSPPAPYAVGEVLDDELIIQRLWPRSDSTRLDLNTLVYRLRKDLNSAGIDASELVKRAPGGGGTRLSLPPAAQVELLHE